MSAWSRATPRIPAAWWDGQPFDRILADVPCTASGIVRRHPDVKWLRREADVAGIRRRSSRASSTPLWPLLAPGGRLLYATCSIFAGRKRRRIDDFCRRHPDALRETLTLPRGVTHRGGQLLPSASGRAPQSGRVLLRAAPQEPVRPAAAPGTLREGQFTAPERGRRAFPPACRPPPNAIPCRPRIAPPPARRGGAGPQSRSPRPGRGAPTAIPVRGASLRSEDGEVLLSAEFDFALNPTLEEALEKGIPLYFMLEFELARPRWYWFDEKVAQWSITYRVSYNALTRQYRVASGLLGQAFDSLDEVERFLGARHVAAGRARRRAREGHPLRSRDARCASTSTSCRSRSRSTRSRRASGTLHSDWYRWSFTP